MKKGRWLRRVGLVIVTLGLLGLAWLYVPLFFEQINTNILDVAVDKAGNIIVIAQKPKSYSLVKFDNQGRLLTEFDSPANSDSQLRYPSNLSLDFQDNIYVINSYDCKLLKFSKAGQFLSSWGSCGPTEQTNGPPTISVDQQGYAYKINQTTQNIAKFDQKGQPLNEFASEYSFKWVFDIAIGPNGDIYVADTGNERIQQYNKDGQFVRKWGSYGSGDDGFARPSRIAINQQGFVYVASMNNKISKFTTAGDFVLSFGGSSQANDYHDDPGDGNFISPRGLAVDKAGYVYVTDEFTRRVQKFDANGKFVSKWEVYLIPDWVSLVAALLVLALVILLFSPYLRRRLRQNR